MIFKKAEGDTRGSLYNQYMQQGNVDAAMVLRGGGGVSDSPFAPDDSKPPITITDGDGVAPKTNTNASATNKINWTLFAGVVLTALFIGYNYKN